MGVAVADARGGRWGHVVSSQCPRSGCEPRAGTGAESWRVAGRRKRMTLAAVGDLELTAAGACACAGRRRPSRCRRKNRICCWNAIAGPTSRSSTCMATRWSGWVNDRGPSVGVVRRGRSGNAPCAVKGADRGVHAEAADCRGGGGDAGARKEVAEGASGALVERAAARFKTSVIRGILWT